IEVVALARTLADASEHRDAAVRFRDVVDELEHRDGLADSGATEQSNLSALRERADQVDHFDAGRKQLHRRRELVELRRKLMDLAPLVGLDGTLLIDRASQHVHDAAERRGTDGNRDRFAGAELVHAASLAVGAAERGAAADT